MSTTMRGTSTPAAPSSTFLSSSAITHPASWSWRALYLLCLCVLLLLPLCAGQCDPCTPGGCGGLDLSNYTKEHEVPGTDSTYTFQMCQDDSSCSGQVCKNEFTSLGSQSTAVWTLKNPNDVSQGATLVVSGGYDSDDGCQGTASSSIAVICGIGNDDFQLNTENNNCLWTFTFNAIAVCNLQAGGGGGGSGAASHGLSGGSIFLILFFVGAFVYFTGGILFNKYRRGLSGAELVPNVTFWRDLPGLVKDGCVFSFNKVRALFGGARTGSLASKGTGSTYETI